ncbi:MBL fold metallo-hydrolase [Pyrolobus fumarii]|uniref:MBL fold metallo-hydrolase n=1 Tax=Pyrolobus fumarii TaxID=54252 RepID=UPI00068E1C96|nr:MBL fold metallo-hydrolase [Pyrolobus fumarii]
MRVWRVARDVLLVDHLFAGLPGIVGTYIIIGDGGEAAVVDPGPRSSIDSVTRVIEERGLRLRYVLLTHIHLDHGASAEILAEKYGAKIIVHPRGAPHLVDPSKLCEAARSLMRDVDLVGCPQGVDEKLVKPTSDGEVVEVGGRRVRVVHTPGHASHHQSFLLEDEGVLFPGDSMGIFYCECVVPLTPPPTRPRMILESIEKMLSLKPRLAALPHFGIHPDPEALAREVVERMQAWVNYESFERLLESDVCARRVYECRRGAPYFGGEVERSWRGLREAREHGHW